MNAKPHRGYGQFCPVAIAAEVLAERWTLLVLRELVTGSSRFNDIHRGVPLMSASLLSDRLRRLEQFGLIEKRLLPDSRVHGYFPTEAGQALQPIIMSIGTWGLKYMKNTFAAQNLDPNLLIWDMKRWLRPDLLPAGRVVIRIDLTNVRGVRQHYWLVKSDNEYEVDVCLHDPGHPVDVVVCADIESLTRVWLGDYAPESAVRDGRIVLDGKTSLRMSFYDWIGLSPFAQ